MTKRKVLGYVTASTPRHVRCPDCNRRLKPHKYDEDDHWGLSPHEKPDNRKSILVCIPPHKRKKK